MKGKSRGISLIELLVVMAILGLLFYCIYSMLVPGLRVWMQSEKKVTLQQCALVSVYRLVNELKESNQNTVTIKNYLPAIDGISTLICFASGRDKTGVMHSKKLSYGSATPYDTGEPDWQKYVLYYLDDKSRLRRYETPNYTAYRQPRGMLLAMEPKDIINAADLNRDRIISQKIEEFAVSYVPEASNWKGAVKIKITAHDRDQDFRTSLETTVGVRYYDSD